MEKRTKEQVSRDIKKIKKAATKACTMKQVEEITGLSYIQIKTTLKKHPQESEKIRKQLQINSCNPQISEWSLEEDKKGPSASKSKKTIPNFVIDTSVCGIEDIFDILEKISTTSSKIVITSVVLKELDTMQKINDYEGNAAKRILALAAENINNYDIVYIDETVGIPDDCIVKYCAENKRKVTLITADKVMALKARMYGIEAKYLKHTRVFVRDYIRHEDGAQISTFVNAKIIDGSLVLIKPMSATQSIQIISNGIEYTDRIRELQVGDTVYIATQKDSYISFVHLKVIKISEERNCELIYAHKFYNAEQIETIKGSYKSFVRAFAKKTKIWKKT